MKYKLLAEKGVHFVCLEDGTKIPQQITTKIEQNCKYPAIADVRCYFDKRIGAPEDIRLSIKDGALHLGDTLLDDLIQFKVLEQADKTNMNEIHFSCLVELMDTVEQPKPYKS